MSRIFWDTNLFIYLFEDYKELSARVYWIRERMLARGDQLFTSTLTLGEVLVKPMEQANAKLRHEYETAIVRSSVLRAFDQEAARIYSSLRASRKIKPADAIQLACAAAGGVDLFITNDGRLSTLIVPGVQFIASLTTAVL